MKPPFALSLSEDGLTLLFRVAEGWAPLGHVGFDAPDLESRLADLRGRAETLAPGGVATKLVLPDTQILYTEVSAPGPDAASRRAQIATALEGRTPYAVVDLAYDWSRQNGGAKVLVAVVARVTLAEAESFAEAQGFNPVAFVAAPLAKAFRGRALLRPMLAGRNPPARRRPPRPRSGPGPDRRAAARDRRDHRTGGSRDRRTRSARGGHRQPCRGGGRRDRSGRDRGRSPVARRGARGRRIGRNRT